MVSCMVSLGCVPPMYSLFYAWHPCMATAYGPVYGPVYGDNHTNNFFGASPPEDHRQQWFD